MAEMMKHIAEGKQAFQDNVPMIHNPYDKYSDEWYWWQDGWKQEWYRDGKGKWHD